MILFLLFNSLWCVGLFVVCQEPFLLHRPAAWLRHRLPSALHKPLFSCPTCMASAHSLPAVLSGQCPLWTWPFYALALAALNHIVVKVFYLDDGAS
jgi:hypothetical protein